MTLMTFVVCAWLIMLVIFINVWQWVERNSKEEEGD